MPVSAARSSTLVQIKMSQILNDGDAGLLVLSF